ncbi:MAG: F0F1 ATP synthase subunit B [Eggerthellaceae bacterium]|nr:F0F1 ATP synthase subunit B [Eggerthellaceae bacterium]
MFKAGLIAACASALSFATPVIAFAEEKSGIDVILPDMNEFIPMLVAFIILVIILAKFGWPIFDGIVKRRDEAIKDSLKKSEDARIESERLLEEYRKQLADAKSQAAQIIADAKKTGESVQADIENKARMEADNMIEKAKAAIDSERKAAISELQGTAADLSISVVARLVGEDLSDDDHRKIIERYVNEAGSFNAN